MPTTIATANSGKGRKATNASMAKLGARVIPAALIDLVDRGTATRIAPVETTVAPRTTTTVPTLPRECADAIRTAEQSLTLLDQTFQSARRFDVGELDRMLSEPRGAP